jgi:hypothetical protein
MLTFERLMDWIEGRLSPEEAAVVAEELANTEAGAAMQSNAVWLRAFLSVSRELDMSSLPRDVHEELMRRFEQERQSSQRPGLFRRLVATLISDSGAQGGAQGGAHSGAQLAIAGLRTADADFVQRQFAYSTDVADVVLNIQPHPDHDGLDLIGQVLPQSLQALPGEAGDVIDFTVQLLRGTAEFGMTATDELGQFAFEGVPAGMYALVISGNQHEIEVPRIDVTL